MTDHTLTTLTEAAYGLVKYGHKTGRVQWAHWDSSRQCADIEFFDEQGRRFSTTALGMTRQEIRAAVADTLMIELMRP